MCDDLTPGMWIKQPAPADMCAIDGRAGHEELNFEAPQTDVGAWMVRWSCYAGEISAWSASVYEVNEDGCSGALGGGSTYFMLVGDTLTVEWGGSDGTREYKHAPDAAKRPGNPALGT